MKRIAALILLAGCSGNEGKERWKYERVVWEERPEIRSPEQAEARKQSLESRKTVTLHDAYELALHRSESLAIQGEEIVRLRTQFDQALGTVLPAIHFKGSYLRQDDAGSDGSFSSFTLAERREYKFTLHQPIFSGLREIYGLRQTDALAEAKEHDLRRARLLLFSDVAQAFYAVVLARRDLATTEHSLRLARERLEELNQRHRANMARRSEVLAQEAESASQEARVQTLRGALEVAWEAFQFLTGLPSRPELLDTLPEAKALPSIPALVEKAAGKREDLRGLDRQIEAAEHGVRVAQGEYLPTLELDANYYLFREGVSEEIDWDLTLSVDLPIFNGLTTFAKIREAESSLRAARLQREQLRRQITLDLQRAWTDVRSLEGSRHSLEKAVASAEENRELVEAEYRQGIATNIEALQSQETSLKSRLARDRTDVELRLAIVRLWVSVGETPGAKP